MSTFDISFSLACSEQIRLCIASVVRLYQIIDLEQIKSFTKVCKTDVAGVTEEKVLIIIALSIIRVFTII